jgi:hypothetical protein
VFDCMRWQRTASMLGAGHQDSSRARISSQRDVQPPLRFLLCIWLRLCKVVAEYLTLSKEERKAKQHIGPANRLPPPKAIAFHAAHLAARASAAARQLEADEISSSRPSSVRSLLLCCCCEGKPSGSS